MAAPLAAVHSHIEAAAAVEGTADKRLDRSSEVVAVDTAEATGRPS